MATSPIGSSNIYLLANNLVTSATGNLHSSNNNNSSMSKDQAFLWISNARNIYYDKTLNQATKINKIFKINKKLAAKKAVITIKDLPGNGSEQLTISATLYTRRLMSFLQKNPVSGSKKAYRLHEKVMRYEKPMEILSNIYNNKRLSLSQRIDEYNNYLIKIKRDNYTFYNIKYFDARNYAHRKKHYKIHIDETTGRDLTTIKLNNNEIQHLKKIIRLQLINMINEHTRNLPELPASADKGTKITPYKPKYGHIINSYTQQIKNSIKKVETDKKELKNLQGTINNSTHIQELLSTTNIGNNDIDHYKRNRNTIKNNLYGCISAENKQWSEYTEGITKDTDRNYYYIEYRSRKNIGRYQKILTTNNFAEKDDIDIASNNESLINLDKEINKIDVALKTDHKKILTILYKIKNTYNKKLKNKLLLSLTNGKSYLVDDLKKYISETTPYHKLYEARKGRLPGGFKTFSEVEDELKKIDDRRGDALKNRGDKTEKTAKKLLKLAQDPDNKFGLHDHENPLKKTIDEYNKAKNDYNIDDNDDNRKKLKKALVNLENARNGALDALYQRALKEKNQTTTQYNGFGGTPSSQARDTFNSGKSHFKAGVKNKKKPDNASKDRAVDNFERSIDKFIETRDLLEIEKTNKAAANKKDREKYLKQLDLIANYNYKTKATIYKRILKASPPQEIKEEAKNFIKNRPSTPISQKLLNKFEEFYIDRGKVKNNKNSVDLAIRTGTIPTGLRFNQKIANSLYTQINKIKDIKAKQSLKAKLGMFYALWLKNNKSSNKTEQATQLFALYDTFKVIKNIAQNKSVGMDIDASDRATVFSNNGQLRNHLYTSITQDLRLPTGSGPKDETNPAYRAAFFHWASFTNGTLQLKHFTGYKHITTYNVKELHMIYLDQSYYQKNETGKWLGIITPEGDIVNAEISNYIKLNASKNRYDIEQLYLNHDKANNEYSISNKPGESTIKLDLHKITFSDLVKTNAKNSSIYKNRVFNKTIKQHLGKALQQLAQNQNQTKKYWALLNTYQPRALLFNHITNYDFCDTKLFSISNTKSTESLIKKLKGEAINIENSEVFEEPVFFNRLNKYLKNKMAEQLTKQ